MHVSFVIPALIHHIYKLPTNKLVLRGSLPPFILSTGPLVAPHLRVSYNSLQIFLQKKNRHVALEGSPRLS